MLKFCYLCLLILVTSCVEKNTKEVDKVGSEDVVSIKPTRVKADKKTILFFGNSLTAGMGLDPDEAFPALIQKKIDSLNFNYTVINSGLSGETTASGKNRLEWVLKQKVDILTVGEDKEKHVIVRSVLKDKKYNESLSEKYPNAKKILKFNASNILKQKE